MTDASSAPINLSAPLVSKLQRCPRLIRLSEGPQKRWRPRELFEVHLRKGILSISAGKDLAWVTKDLQASFLEQCAAPGLDVDCQPYQLAQDWVAILGNVLESFSRQPVLMLEPGPKVILGPDLTWECKAFADETGVLHRYAAVDKLDRDSLTRELHSWHVDGDRCAAQMPMKLHIVEIGRLSGNHQSSPWCRIYKHPTVINRFAFQQKDGTPLEGAWKPSWFQDSDRNKSKDWVDLMERDGVKLIKHIDVKAPSESQVTEFVRQMTIEAERLKQVEISTWNTFPMYRPACDLPNPCHYQNDCFSVK